MYLWHLVLKKRLLKEMFREPLVKKTIQLAILFVALFVLCYFTKSYAAVPIALYCIWAAFQKRLGHVFVIILLLSFMVMLGPYVLIRDANFGKIVRLTVLLSTCALLVSSGSLKGNERIPIQTIVFFLVAAFISSMNGWVPLLGYLKILNFALFIFGIFLITKDINVRHGDIFLIRAAVLAISLIWVYGSLAVLPFPGVAYYTSLRGVIASEGIEFASNYYTSMEYEGMSLFTGITIHSQFLGPLLACLFGILTCDMLFVEKRLHPLHLAILAPMPIMLYMTRARIGVLAFVVFIFVAIFVAIPFARLDNNSRRRLQNLMILMTVIMIAIGVKFEIEHKSMSKLIRKTDDIAYDSRSLTRAATESRYGTIEECMRDFRMNPMFGMGFQMSETHRFLQKEGKLSYFSAPIEKGLLPLMILGETGIVGAMVFLYFLCAFFSECKKRGYVVTSTMMLVFLATNMAEATFFSPGGGGGVFWLITVGAGFVVDMAVRSKERPMFGINGVMLGTRPKGVGKVTRIKI